MCMCGIAGLYAFENGGVRETDLSRMRDTLAHRGPDGKADYCSPDGTVGLAQRRLAIIDLRPEAGCPMPNEDKSLWITFNGEIYNFKKLREELLKKGHTFRSHGDTETILHGYEEWGTDIVKRLNGMFAFALWDDNKKILFAARDHVGIKPFYYALQNGAFYFGSEIKAILAHPKFERDLDEPMIGHYLTFSCVPAPHTLFREVKKLPAAHALTVDANGKVHTWEYWNPLKPDHRMPEGKPEKFYVEAARTILNDAIEMQMISDVPFGCFLSGGIDSSLNAALMTNALGKPVETFSIGSANEKYDEFAYSRKVAGMLHAKTHERTVGFDDFLRYLDHYGIFADDPNGDQTNFLVYYLSELVRSSGVVVVQTGEGGDELFAGYGTYKKAAALYPVWRFFSNLPAFVKRLANAIVQSLPFSRFTKEYAFRFARGEEPFPGHAIAFGSVQKHMLLAKPYRDNPAWNAEHAIVKKYYDEAEAYAPQGDFLNRVAYLELKMRLADFLLMRVDKMGMAHSIEARVPFLDYRLVELALAIPEKIKLKNGELKHVLKEVAKGVLPNDIIHRKKQGFGAPVEEWFRSDETSAVLLQKIYASKLAERGFFDYDYVRRLAARHKQGENHTFRLMNLLTLSLWYDTWFG
jgi:asparagine synthase (glutamine-hydrolysing)